MTRAWTWEFEGRAAGSIGLGGWGGGRCAREATPGDRTRAPPRGSRRSVPVRGADDGAARDGDESSTSLERDTETRAVSRARLSRRPRDAHQISRTFEPCASRAEESRDARERASPGLRQNLCARRGSRHEWRREAPFVEAKAPVSRRTRRPCLGQRRRTTGHVPASRGRATAEPVAPRESR